MKKTDVAMVVLIAVVSAGIAYFIASSIFGGLSEQNTKVQTIELITSEVNDPDKNIFNESSLNPSVEVNINSTDAVSGASTTNTTGTTASKQ